MQNASARRCCKNDPISVLKMATLSKVQSSMRSVQRMMRHKTEHERILIVDDEESICRLCAYGLSNSGLATDWTTTPQTALQKLASEHFDLLITDIKMPEMTGIELMHRAHAINPTIGVLVMTAHATLQIAIDALKEGANDFVHKPFHLDELKFAVRSVLDNVKLVQENMRLKSLVHLVEVAENINKIEAPAELYATIMEAAIRETGATRGKIYQIDENTHELKLVQDFSSHAAPRTNGKIATADIPVPKHIPSTIAIPLRANNKLKGVLSLFDDSGREFSEIDQDIANMLGMQATIALENTELLSEVEQLFLETIKSLASTLDEKDPYTHGHSQRVARIAREIGQRIDLDANLLEMLHLAGSLHDIGKIGIPDKILLKPGRLTPEEYEIIKTHPEKGAKILQHIRRLSPVIEAVYTHHEWYNGHGYPRGLAGEAIPLAGSIICVADALDSITTDRTYRQRRTPLEAYRIIRENAGTQFHPDIVDVVLQSSLTSLAPEGTHAA